MNTFKHTSGPKFTRTYICSSFITPYTMVHAGPKHLKKDKFIKINSLFEIAPAFPSPSKNSHRIYWIKYVFSELCGFIKENEAVQLSVQALNHSLNFCFVISAVSFFLWCSFRCVFGLKKNVPVVGFKIESGSKNIILGPVQKRT